MRLTYGFPMVSFFLQAIYTHTEVIEIPSYISVQRNGDLRTTSYSSFEKKLCSLAKNLAADHNREAFDIPSFYIPKSLHQNSFIFYLGLQLPSVRFIHPIGISGIRNTPSPQMPSFQTMLAKFRAYIHRYIND